ncbi:U-box domain-containing protein [Hyaloraphidium curvatum]|nr:U-box domain-containing protein [Hyaloraphidium curvatum]
MAPPAPAPTPQEVAAEHWKSHGNTLFGKGDHAGAINAYTTAIINNPKVASYFTNRALCYTRMKRYGEAARDSRKAIELDKDGVKGHYYLGMALTEGIWERNEREEERERDRRMRERERQIRREMGEPEPMEEVLSSETVEEGLEITGSMSEAVDELTIAYDLAIKAKVPYLEDVLKALRKARRRRWDMHDRKLTREETSAESFFVGLIESHRQREVARVLDQWKARHPHEPEPAGDAGEDPSPARDELRRALNDLHSSLDTHLSSLHNTFHAASQHREPGRTLSSSAIPDAFLGKIHFGVMVDPVVTPSGITYDRSEILDHLRHIGPWDPLSRRALTEKELVPNLALKEAIEHFLENNGWAADA